MSTTMEDIKKVIETNLPELVAGELKNILTEYQDLKIEREYLKSKIKDLDQDNERLKGFKNSSEDLKDKETNLYEKEQELAERERNLKVQILEERLVCQTSTNNSIIHFVDSLMRNTVYRKNAFPNIRQEWVDGEQRDTVLCEDTENIAE